MKEGYSKMDKKRFKYVIPIMVVVAIGSFIMLTTKYEEVATKDAILIGVVATIFSGMIGYQIFPSNDEKKPDPKPNNSDKKVVKKK